MEPLPAQSDSRKPPRDRNGFLYRLSIYCIGVAIGFLILGMFRTKSAAEAQRRAAAQAALEAEYGSPNEVATDKQVAKPAQDAAGPETPR
ncbi:MAG: hypothetical protein KF691_04325 [Phycisphaeraceae bacterium]|nr:hypothetical protein [Phycisphaeraceae bacterium]